MTTPLHRSGLLLLVAALGAVGMFAGTGSWLGMDLGATGAVVLYAALVLLAVHLSRNPEDTFPVNAALNERLAWVSVVFLTLIVLHWVNYIVRLPELGAAADQIWNPAAQRFWINVGTALVGWIVFIGIVRSGNSDPVELDERDLRIQHAANRAGSTLTAVLIVVTIAALQTQPESLTPWLRPLIVANFLIGLLLLDALSQNVFIVARYRRAHA